MVLYTYEGCFELNKDVISSNVDSIKQCYDKAIIDKSDSFDTIKNNDKFICITDISKSDEKSDKCNYDTVSKEYSGKKINDKQYSARYKIKSQITNVIIVAVMFFLLICMWCVILML
jgi:hypothetical protein